MEETRSNYALGRNALEDLPQRAPIGLIFLDGF
jgi:hypothetical protein